MVNSKMKENRWNLKKSERLLTWTSIIYLIVLITGVMLKCKNLIFLILILVFFFIIAIASFTVVFLEFKEIRKKEPYTLISGVLASLFMCLPYLFLVFGEQKASTGLVKLFYTISVGVGINYVIDSIFKYIEPEFDDQKKRILIKKSAFTKIIFNVIYISEYLSFILLENQNSIYNFFKQWKINELDIVIRFCCNLDDWIKLTIITLTLFVIFICIVFYIMRAIEKEIIEESSNDLTEIRKKLSNDIKQVSDLMQSLIQDDILKDLSNLKQKMDDELNRLDKMDLKK
mgnify:FL=1